jgi:phage I-like protein
MLKNLLIGAVELDFSTLKPDGTIEVQIAPEGMFDHPEFGMVDASAKKLDAMISHFKRRAAKEIVTDFNHGTSKARATEEEGKASGWIKKLIRKVGEGVFAVWKPTAAAIQRGKDEEYKYFSPTLAWDYYDPFLKETIPLALNAAGFTNRPFFEQMKPVEFSAVSDGSEEGQTGEWFYSPEEGQTFQQTKTDGGASYPAAAYAYVPDPESPSTWKLRLWETPEKKITARQVGLAVAALGPGGFRGQRVQLPADARAGVISKVRAAWRKANPDKSPDQMPGVLKASTVEDHDMKDFMQKLREKLGEKVGEKHFSAITDEEPKAEDLVEAIASTMTDFSTANTKLQEQLDKKSESEAGLQDRVTTLEANAVKRDIDAVLDKVTRENRIKVAERDFWAGQLQKDFANVKEHLEKKDPILDTKPKGSGSEDGTGPESEVGREAEQKFMAAVNKKRGENKELSFEDAMREVILENPELEARYREETYARIEGQDL